MARPRAQDTDQGQGVLGEGFSADDSSEPTGPFVAFVGIAVNWDRRIGDVDMNTKLAEQWEDDFSSWDIGDRSVFLRTDAEEYRVRLGDGFGRFMLGTEGYHDVALDHVGQMFSNLHRHERSLERLSLEIQFICPVEISFDELVAHLRNRILHAGFIEAIGASVTDLNYLIDAEVGGTAHQLNIGPVRANEIIRKVSAVRPQFVPDRAIYLAVATNVPEPDGDAAFVRQKLNDSTALGNSVMGALK